MKKSTTRPKKRTPAPIHPGEVLWAIFMRPRRLSSEKIAAAFPPHPRFSEHSWKEALNEFLRASPDDSVLDIDLAMGLDRFFGLPDGWWYQLMDRYYILCELRDNSKWLDAIQTYHGGYLHIPSADSFLLPGGRSATGFRRAKSKQPVKPK